MNFFGRQTGRGKPEQIESVIGPTANLRGTLRSDGGIRIDGAFEGVIETAGNVVIGETARVMADITARNVTVAGAVKGNIDATGRLEILSTGVVYGDMQVQSVMIDDGGQFHGLSRMRGLDHPALAPPADHRSDGAEEAPEYDIVLDDTAVESTARPAAEDDGDTEADRAAADEGTDAEPGADEVPEKKVSKPAAAKAKKQNGVLADDDFEIDIDLDMEIEPVMPENGGSAKTSRGRSTGTARKR